MGIGLLFGSASGQRVMVHGYATQGLGSTSDYAQAGLGTGASADIRAAALQARLMFPSWGTQLLVQGSHRRVGGSPVAGLIDEVELDWAFAQQTLGDFSARVGRIPIPKGLLNEVRDVGVILPFYKAPNAFYTEGIETVDGATARYSKLFGPIEAEAQGFYGSIPVVIQISSAQGPKALDKNGKATWGGQFSLGLPLRGLKAIGGLLDSDVMATIPNPMGPPQKKVVDWKLKWFGLEYRGERALARAEHSRSEVPGSSENTATYYQAGVNVWKGLWLNGQHETAWVKMTMMNGHEYDSVKDWALGASYAINRNLVLKGEHHWSEGYDMDEAVNIMGPPVQNRFFVLSLSAAF
jgi:hypothetical protein